MKLINTNNILSFSVEEDQTKDKTETDIAAEKDFLEYMKQYTMKVNGAGVLVYDQQNRLMICINPFDSTLFICNDDNGDAYELASRFGAKRFVVGAALQQINEDRAKQSNIVNFPRDLLFPIEKRENEIVVDYKVLDLAGVTDYFRADKTKLYDQLSKLFILCADFTQGKLEEYKSGGNLQDKYCRFNPENNIHKNEVLNDQIFLMDNKNNIIGTISAAVIENNHGGVDIYFYDEIVDYFTLLNENEIKWLNEKTEQLNKAKGTGLEATLKKEIAELIEPKRAQLMAQLFAAARQHLRKSVSDLDAKIANGLVHAFIRAAAGREAAYVDLGCSKTNTTSFVIHGPRTAQLNMLDADRKAWAAEKLKALQPTPSTLSLLSSQERVGVVRSSLEQLQVLNINTEAKLKK